MKLKNDKNETLTAKDSNVALIRAFFKPPHVSLDEIKAIAKEDRQELGDMIREEIS